MIMNLIKISTPLYNLLKFNINFIIAAAVSGTFLGISRNEDDLVKGIFVVPFVSYLYSYIVIKKPYLIIIYLLCFYVSKKKLNYH